MSGAATETWTCTTTYERPEANTCAKDDDKYKEENCAHGKEAGKSMTAKDADKLYSVTSPWLADDTDPHVSYASGYEWKQDEIPDPEPPTTDDTTTTTTNNDTTEDTTTADPQPDTADDAGLIPTPVEKPPVPFVESFFNPTPLPPPPKVANSWQLCSGAF